MSSLRGSGVGLKGFRDGRDGEDLGGAYQVQVSEQKLLWQKDGQKKWVGVYPGETGLSNADPSLVPALRIKLLTIR